MPAICRCSMSEWLDKAAISGTINKENPVCWGKISVSDLMKENPEISLLRQFAKVNVKYEKTTSSDFNDDKTFELESSSCMMRLTREP